MFNTDPVADHLYHATLPHVGETHVAYLGPLQQIGGGMRRGYLVVANLRLTIVQAPTVTARDYNPSWALALESIRKISVHSGPLATVFTVNEAAARVIHAISKIGPAQVMAFRDLLERARAPRFQAAVAAAEAAKLAASIASRPAPPLRRSDAITREKEVIREIVKVPCNYCGQLRICHLSALPILRGLVLRSRSDRTFSALIVYRIELPCPTDLG